VARAREDRRRGLGCVSAAERDELHEPRDCRGERRAAAAAGVLPCAAPRGCVVDIHRTWRELWLVGSRALGAPAAPALAIPSQSGRYVEENGRSGRAVLLRGELLAVQDDAQAARSSLDNLRQWEGARSAAQNPFALVQEAQRLAAHGAAPAPVLIRPYNVSLLRRGPATLASELFSSAHSWGTAPAATTSRELSDDSHEKLPKAAAACTASAVTASAHRGLTATMSAG